MGAGKWHRVKAVVGRTHDSWAAVVLWYDAQAFKEILKRKVVPGYTSLLPI